MENDTTRPPLRTMAAIHKVNFSTLGQWQRAGVDVYDTPSLVEHIRQARTRPKAWRDCLLSDGTESDTMEGLRKRRLKADSERLEVQTAKARGELVSLESCNNAGVTMAHAFKGGLERLLGTLPEHLAGLDHGEIHDRLDAAFDDLLTELSDLNSSLWSEAMSANENASKLQ